MEFPLKEKNCRVLIFLVLGLLTIREAECSCRKHVMSLTDFGGVGDGVTLNTKAFTKAIDHLSQFGSDGGSLLFVPAGKWLTGSFSLTSHFTLYLHKDAVILGSTDPNDYPILAPLPSYGKGRDAPDGRYQSLLFGTNLTDVVLTGNNGTINGQGAIWWERFKKEELNYTRSYLFEIMFSDQIQITNLTFLNSPSWNIHPIYSSNILVKYVTILADPFNSKNTDGINPDSSKNVRIEDCFVVSGDDCIAIKSGWDQYGIAFGMPSKNITIRRLTCISPTSAGIALGSEMSGGISDVRAEDIHCLHTESAVRIKTAVGRGAYVRDIYVKGLKLETMKYVFWMTGSYGSHPDNGTNMAAIPVVERISYSDITAENVTIAGALAGINGAPFRDICISNASMTMFKSKKLPWNCTDIEGFSNNVTPAPCSSLPVKSCPFSTTKPPLEDIDLEVCSYAGINKN